MTPNGDIALISDSLTISSERLGDIAPHVYRRFFELDASAANLMEYSDTHMRGRMFASVLELFLSDDPFKSDGFLAWELDNHVSAYSVTTTMYESLFKAFIDVVKDSLGEAWSPEVASAWTARTARIMTEVKCRD